jgi:hypothetical protein
MNQQIKEKVMNCETCLKYRSKQPHMEMQSHQNPSSPYKRVGLDLLELSMEGKKVIALVTTDHYSDFIEGDFLKSTTADVVVECCKHNFARHGIPKAVVTDNGPQLISAEFGNFASKREFSHQQANGKSDASVKIVIRMYRKYKDSEEEFWKALMFQRNTPNQIGTSPNGRIFGGVTHGLISINEQRLKPEMWGRPVKEDIARVR